MYAHKLNINIPTNHKLTLKLPDMIPEGLAEVIILSKPLDICHCHDIPLKQKKNKKLSWEDTYKAMSESDEDWSDWADLDLEDI